MIFARLLKQPKPNMAKHRPKWHRIKVHRSYTVDEAARELGIVEGTVRRWLKGGELPYLNDQKPALILGVSLRAFGQNRTKSKVICKPYEFYCFKCRAPRVAAGNMADFVQRSPKSGNLRAICACDTIMNKNVSQSSLQALAEVLDIAMHQAPEHLVKWR